MGCYSNNPCSCHVDCSCNGQNIQCTVKAAECITNVYTWTVIVNSQTKIKTSYVTELRNNIRSEQARRSYTVSTGNFANATTSACSPQTTFTTNVTALQALIGTVAWAEMKTAINTLGNIAEVGLSFTWTTITAYQTKIRTVITPAQLRTNLDNIHKKCVCNAKSNCGCNAYCGSNSVWGCGTNGCGYCYCYGDCGCNY